VLLVQPGPVIEQLVRRARPADAAALVTLRAAMFAAMGTDPGGPAETAAGTVELAATAAGIGIYRSLGFAEPEYRVLRLAIPR
jgi:hypothetical protein